MHRDQGQNGLNLRQEELKACLFIMYKAIRPHHFSVGLNESLPLAAARLLWDVHHLKLSRMCLINSHFIIGSCLGFQCFRVSCARPRNFTHFSSDSIKTLFLKGYSWHIRGNHSEVHSLETEACLLYIISFYTKAGRGAEYVLGPFFHCEYSNQMNAVVLVNILVFFH